jgi:hypothetical protein
MLLFLEILRSLLAAYNLSEVLTASIIKVLFIALIMEAVNTSETSVSFYQTTRRNTPEDGQSPSYPSP